MASKFQQLLARLHSEFEALQQENLRLREELQETLAPEAPKQSPWSVQREELQETFATETPKQSPGPAQSPWSPRVPTNDRDGLVSGLASPQPPKDAAVCLRPANIKLHSADERPDEVIGDEECSSESDPEPEFSISGSGGQSPSAPSLTRSLRRLSSSDGLFRHYAKVLHRTTRFVGSSLIETTSYRLCVAAFIVLDCSMIMWNCHYFSRDQAPLGIRSVAVLVCVFFATDGMLRLRQHCCISRSFDHWRDAFDTACLAIMVLDEICLFTRGATYKVSWASVMRGFRVLRLFYACRYFVKAGGAYRLLREFDWLLHALMSTSGWRTVLCVLFYIGIVFSICSIALTDGALYLQCEFDVDDNILCKHFGTLRRTFLTLFKVTYGGISWGDIFDSLDELSYFYSLVFALFLLSYSILLVNTGIGAILRVCQDSTDQQKYMDNLRKESGKQEDEVRLMEQLFMEIDINDNGAISRTEFELALKDPHMTSMLSVLQLQIFDLQAIFPLFDLNGSGEISLDEFVLGCMRMKGKARALDVIQLQAALVKITEELGGLQQLQPGTGPGIRNSKAPSLLNMPSREHSHRPSDHSNSDNRPSNHTLNKLKTLRFEREDLQCGQSIPKCEMRAMSLRELKRVPGLIKDALAEEKWVDMQKGSQLAIGDVNLYHFNYYYMCAKTTPFGVDLDGLDAATYEIGDDVVQYDPHKRGAVPLATGVVVSSSDEHFQINVIQGHFKAGYPVKVKNVDRGKPTGVEATGAISFKEHISSQPLKPRWFCSHWWGEKIVHFVQCCAEHAWRRRLADGEAAYWVCAYANRQYNISDEISDDPSESSFCKALELAEGVVVFLDSKSTPFKRIWCCFELYLTIMSGTKAMDIVTVRQANGSDVAILLSDGQLPCETQMAKTERERHFPLRLLVHGMRADLTQGEATVERDRELILRAIKHSHYPEASVGVNTWRAAHSPVGVPQPVSQIEQANGALNAVFAQAAWILSLRKGLDVEDIDPPLSLSLPSKLSCDTRRKLMFSFELFPEITDVDLLLFARGLSPSYKEIHLSFGNCRNISDRGMKDLAEHLPHFVETCRLDFVGCTAITSKGLACLAKGLPPGILNLRLDFACCPEIDIAGVKFLAEHLPDGIKKFYATFPGTQVGRNFRSISELHALSGRGRPFLSRAKDKIGQFAAYRNQLSSDPSQSM